MTELTIEESFTITCLTHTLAFGKTLGSNAVGGRPWKDTAPNWVKKYKKNHPEI